MSRNARAMIALGLALTVFAWLLVWTHLRWQPVPYVDEHALRSLHHYAVDHPAFVTTMKVVSAVGSWSTYSVLFAGTVAWLLLRKQPRLALFVAVTPLTSSLLNGWAKRLGDRRRPELANPVAHADGLSFPSGHAQSAAVAALVLIVIVFPTLRRRGRRVAVVSAAVFVLSVGFSRVALGVHYASDVLAGYALGVAWVVIVATALVPCAQLRTRSVSLSRAAAGRSTTRDVGLAIDDCGPRLPPRVFRNRNRR